MLLSFFFFLNKLFSGDNCCGDSFVYVAQAGLELVLQPRLDLNSVILLSQLLAFWDYEYALPQPARPGAVVDVEAVMIKRQSPYTHGASGLVGGRQYRVTG